MEGTNREVRARPPDPPPYPAPSPPPGILPPGSWGWSTGEGGRGCMGTGEGGHFPWNHTYRSPTDLQPPVPHTPCIPPVPSVSPPPGTSPLPGSHTGTGGLQSNYTHWSPGAGYCWISISTTLTYRTPTEGGRELGAGTGGGYATVPWYHRGHHSGSSGELPPLLVPYGPWAGGSARICPVPLPPRPLAPCMAPSRVVPQGERGLGGAIGRGTGGGPGAVPVCTVQTPTPPRSSPLGIPPWVAPLYPPRVPPPLAALGRGDPPGGPLGAGRTGLIGLGPGGSPPYPGPGGRYQEPRGPTGPAPGAPALGSLYGRGVAVPAREGDPRGAIGAGRGRDTGSWPPAGMHVIQYPPSWWVVPGGPPGQSPLPPPQDPYQGAIGRGHQPPQPSTNGC